MGKSSLHKDAGTMTCDNDHDYDYAGLLAISNKPLALELPS